MYRTSFYAEKAYRKRYSAYAEQNIRGTVYSTAKKAYDNINACLNLAVIKADKQSRAGSCPAEKQSPQRRFKLHGGAGPANCRRGCFYV
ncbi:MAG: hypothetical protein Q4E74_12060 [Ruminococcus sp.]|nr:hypothetical protein [Ruminococcus sp.]